MNKINVSIRWMIRRDLERVLEIEKLNFEYPWNEQDFLESLRTKNKIGMVATYNDEVVGFMMYELCKTRIQILNIAVMPRYKGKSVGIQMIDKLKSKLSNFKRTKLRLDIRESNLDAQLFFKALGFKAINVLKSYYEETDEDAYVMQYKLCENSKIMEAENAK